MLKPDVVVQCIKAKGNLLREAIIYAAIEFSPLFGGSKGIDAFRLQVSEEHAIKAGVAALADDSDAKGWFTRPALYWYVFEDDHQTYNRAVGVLSKICQVR